MIKYKNVTTLSDCDNRGQLPKQENVHRQKYDTYQQDNAGERYRQIGKYKEMRNKNKEK